jgi:ABC-type sugar transport system substrate-binding protein
MTRVVLSLVDSGNGYQQLLHEDAKAAAKRAGLELETHFCESDFAKQLEQLGNALEQQPAALAVMAVHDRGLGRVVRHAAEDGVHTILLNETEDDLDEIRRRFPGVAACQMCADEEETGRIQGRIARALLPRGGRLLLVEGTRRSFTARGRTAGLQEALQDAGIEMDRLEAGWTAADGEAAAHRWLRIAMQFNRALNLVVCHNDSLAVGVRGALEKVALELERPEARQIPIVGCDGAPELGLAMVQEGSLTATVVQPRLSGDAVDSIARVLRGGPLPPPVSRVAGTSHPEAILFSGARAGAQIATTG